MNIGIKGKSSAHLHENIIMPDRQFPVWFFYYEHENPSNVFALHWHEQIEFIYVKTGSMQIECGNRILMAYPGDLVVINSNEYHICAKAHGPLFLYCIIADMSLLNSRLFDVCERKYILPLFQNHILFENLVRGDSRVAECIEEITAEFAARETGYELAIKASLYNLLVSLFRRHVGKVLTPREQKSRNKNIQKVNTAMKYIQENYAEDIRTAGLAGIIGMNKYNLCRLFKEYTGKTPTEYINGVRIREAVRLLRETDLNITSIATRVGFNDVNYFSRVFRKYENNMPSIYKKSGSPSDT